MFSFASVLHRRIAVSLMVFASVLALAAGPAAAQDGTQPVTVPLNEVEHSGIKGTVTLTPDGGRTWVDMELTGKVTGDHPTHIHTGTCANFDPNPLYPLETVVLESVDKTGTSKSVVTVPLEDLESSNFVILVHFSHERLTDYLVCGEIPRMGSGDGLADTSSGITGGETQRASSADHDDHDNGSGEDTDKYPNMTSMPTTGTGSGDQDNQAALTLAATLALMGVGACTAAVWSSRKAWSRTD